MMKNKKLAALLGVLLAGSMAVSMAACGSSNNASDTKRLPAPPTPPRRTIQPS